jgi:hypothetical protein
MKYSQISYITDFSKYSLNEMKSLTKSISIKERICNNLILVDFNDEKAQVTVCYNLDGEFECIVKRNNYAIPPTLLINLFDFKIFIKNKFEKYKRLMRNIESGGGLETNNK